LPSQPAVGAIGLPANLLSEFQRIHFSSHETFCRNSCARKIRLPPRFIDDFGLPLKNTSNCSAAVVEAAPSLVFRQS
jgi:hypothetical protein